MDAIVGGLVQLGIAGVMAAAVVGFLWHLVTKTLPDLTRSFQAEQANERKDFKEELAIERLERDKRHAETRADLEKLHADRQRRHIEMLSAMDRVAQVNQTGLDRLFEFLTGHHKEVMEEFRIVRHGVRELTAIPKMVEWMDREFRKAAPGSPPQGQQQEQVQVEEGKP